MTGLWRLRAAILLLVGGLAVHRGRYAFASAEHEHHLSSAHEYLVWLSPAAAVLSFLAVVQLTASLSRGAATTPSLPGARALWLAASSCLLGVFATQECLETLFAHGHLPGVVELLGSGGWTAIPFAAAAGGAIALLLRGAERLVRWALARSRPRARHAPRAVLGVPRTVLAPPPCVLARRLAGRAPSTHFEDTTNHAPVHPHRGARRGRGGQPAGCRLRARHPATRRGPRRGV